ncbi:MAG: hypothetical protein R3293_25985, partial [Candidatus Promineifilaceae bacterium]|nr:hypothetical protein [Candidatus Promineifilaceae bacterium]
LTSLWSTSTTLAIGSAAAVGLIPVIMTIFLIIIALIIANRDHGLGFQADASNFKNWTHL